VHQSGGSVTVTSELGAGTRFTLYLPKATAPGKATAARGEPVAGVGGTVLLIEDNPEVAQVSAALLAQLGYEVVTAVNAEHALEVLAGGRRVDLVFTDVVMPGMDGIALARKLGELHPHLPVLVTTGYANAAEKVDLPILRKPYDIGDLGRAVANLLAGRNASDTNLVKFRRGKPRRPRS
jgi:CheY-like chemotaxis protein